MLAKYKKHFVAAMFAGLKVVSRHKWTGIEAVISTVILAQSVHSLFADALVITIEHRKVTTSVLDGWHLEVSEQAGIAKAWLATSFLPRLCHELGLNFIYQLVLLSNNFVLPRTDLFHFARQKAVSKGNSPSSGFHRLIVLLGVSMARLHLMREMLKISSVAWEVQQDVAYIRTGQRQHLACLRASHALTRPALEHLGTLTLEQFPIQGPITCALRNLSWKLIARAASTIDHYLLKDERRGPFPLLTMDYSVNPEERARRILQTPKCMLDSWSLNFLSRYGTLEALLAPQAVAERQSILMTLKLCTTQIEARHSAVRRLCKTKSLQSRAADLPALSAAFVLRYM